MSITASSSSEWRISPASVEARFWCDEAGDNAALTVRLRVDFGTLITRPPDTPFGDDFMAVPLSTHTVAAKKSYPQNFMNAMQEVYLFLDFVGPGGSVIETVAIAHDSASIQDKLNIDSQSALSLIQVDVNATIVDGQTFARARFFTLGSGRLGRGAPSVHIMSPASNTIEHDRAAIAVTSATNAVAQGGIFRHLSYPPVLNCLPEDKAFCASVPDARLRPLYASNCSTIEKSSHVRGAFCGNPVSALVLSLSDIPNSTFYYLLGTYELSNVSGMSTLLSECQFWYEDSPGTSLTFGRVLERIEISASCVVDANPFTPINSCDPVSARLSYAISFIIRESPTIAVRYTSLDFLNVPEGFLYGDAVPVAGSPAELSFRRGASGWRGGHLQFDFPQSFIWRFQTGGVTAQLA
jgi:hypothetical protein